MTAPVVIVAGGQASRVHSDRTVVPEQLMPVRELGPLIYALFGEVMTGNVLTTLDRMALALSGNVVPVAAHRGAVVGN